MIALLQAAWIVGLAAQSRQQGTSWAAPDRAASNPNPLAGRPELASGGRKIFEQRCAQCHGDDAQGTSRAPSLLSRRVQAETDGALFWKISSGDTRAGMPSFSYLPAPERWQVILHLRSVAHLR
jgi:mono/diheme cytochrome c family protein